MFRCHVRAGIFVMLCVSVLAGIGLSLMLSKVSLKKNKIIITVLIIVLVVIEFINIPPVKITDAVTMPDVYCWLRKQDGDFAIAEYPISESDTTRHCMYLFYQRMHQKKMINGAQRNTIAHYFKERIYNLSDPNVPVLLSYLQVKYILIHKDIYKDGQMPYAIRKYHNPTMDLFPKEYNNGNVPDLNGNSGFKLIRRFNDTDVYEVVSPRPDRFLYLSLDDDIYNKNKGQLPESLRKYYDKEYYIIFPGEHITLPDLIHSL